MRVARGESNPTMISEIKQYLRWLGYPLTDEGKNKGVFGPTMEFAVADFQAKFHLPETGIVDQETYDALKNAAQGKRGAAMKTNPSNPAYEEAKKYAGQGENNSKFVAFMAGFWNKVGLNYKTIVGSSFAWCALFIVAMNSQVGQKYIASASAKAQSKYGVEIEFKKNGAPRGAVVHVNHGHDCKSGSNNHVAFLDGDCTAEDFTRKGGVIPLFGGNQSNMVKRSGFSNLEICEVRWPTEVPLPGPVTKSVDCNGKTGTESTR